MQRRPTPPFLVLVVPCYNEEETLPRTMDALTELLSGLRQKGLISERSCVCYVDDGSMDRTWELIETRHLSDPGCLGIKFAGNAGHQNAVWAGMAQAREWGADCMISLDADLQDDINVIPQMLEKYAGGYDIVYGVRNNRETDTRFKRVTAHLFYALMHRINVALIPDHADYRLASRPVLEALRGFEEHSLFLRGLFPILGFKTGIVYYRRLGRVAGQSKYPLRKMLSFAWQGITACSVAPLRIAGLLSIITMLIALVIGCVCLWQYFDGDTVQGWTSIIVVVLFLGSAQLFCLAVIGEYLAKVFTEVRHRPRYIIEKKILN